MSSRLSEFIALNKHVITNTDWLISSLSYVIKRVFLMFFTLFMINQGYYQDTISLFYFTLFFASFLFIYLFNFISKKNHVLTFLLMLSLLSIGLFLNNKEIVLLVLSLTLFFMFSEVYSVKGVSSLVKDVNKEKSNKIIAISQLYSVLFPAFAFVFIGFFSDKNEYFIIYAIIGIKILVISLFISSFKKIEKTRPYNVLKLIIDIHRHTLLSLMYNSVSFVGLFMLVPLILIEISHHLGVENHSFKILGVLIGLMSIANLIYSLFLKNKEIQYQIMMRNNVSILCSIWITLSIVYVALKNYDINSHYILIISIVLIALVLSIDYFSKLWSIGFLNSLRNLSEDKDIPYEKSLYLFNIYKNLGFSFGFLLVYMFSPIINLSYIMITISIVTIVYSYSLTFKKSN